MMRFVDLFAGIGGFRLGFEGIGARCVFTSEINKFARRTYASNFVSDHDLAGDITKIQVKDIPAHDILLAGFPCQPFSVAGTATLKMLDRKIGMDNDLQGNLFMEIVRVLKHHQTPVFVLENVPNLKGFDKGVTFKMIMDILVRQLGYQVDYKVINSNPWLPQNRKRLFIVGFKPNVDFYFDGFFGQKGMPLPPKPHPVLRSILFENDTVPDKYSMSELRWASIIKRAARTEWGSYSVFTPDDVGGTLVACYHSEPKENLIDQPGKPTPRRLMPREAARLMGFPDTFNIVVSNTQAYHQFGNAVCPPVVRAIAQYMHPYIQKAINNA